MIVKGKRLMPTYLISFLKEIYPGDIPANFGKRMVSRQSIAYLKQMYLLFGGESIDNFGRDMCPEYLIKYLEYLINADYIEYEDDTVAYTKETPENALKYAFLNYVGGMCYKEDGVIKESLVTSVNSLALTNNDDKYGWGIDSSTYNYRDYNENKGYQVVNRIDLGTLSFIRRADLTDVNCFSTNGVTNYLKSYLITALCAKYTYIGTVNNYSSMNNKGDKCFAFYYEPNTPETSSLYINDSDYETPADLKNGLSGVYLYYGLETEVEEDIDSIDNVIDVSSGETTFNNEYEQDVPSSISYFIPNV